MYYTLSSLDLLMEVSLQLGVYGLVLFMCLTCSSSFTFNTSPQIIPSSLICVALMVDSFPLVMLTQALQGVWPLSTHQMIYRLIRILQLCDQCGLSCMIYGLHPSNIMGTSTRKTHKNIRTSNGSFPSSLLELLFCVFKNRTITHSAKASIFLQRRIYLP